VRPANAPDSIVTNDVQHTSFNDRLVVTAWYDGKQVTEALPVTAYAFDWAASRRVHGQATFVFADPDGDLWPRSIADALGVAGSRLQVAYWFGATDTVIPLGWWRIRRTDPDILWQWRYVEGQHVWLPGGGTVTVQADEELVSYYLERLDIGERATTRNSVLAEVEHLARNPYLGFEVNQGVANRPLQTGLALPENRLDAIQQLLDRIGATYRQSPTGLEVIPAAGTAVEWRIEPGEGGTLIRLENTMDDRDLANGVTSWRDLDTQPGSSGGVLVGRARLVDGPLRWGGPFGRVLMFRGANLATEQAQVDEDAATTLARITQTGDVHLSLETLCHPGLQLGDRVTLLAPEYPAARPLEGRVVQVGWRGTDGLAEKKMSLTVAVPHDQFHSVERNLNYA